MSALLPNTQEELNEKDYDQFKNLYDISKILNTGLTPDVLFYCMKLCESGVHPHALADVVKTIKGKVEEYNKIVSKRNSKELNLTSEWNDVLQ